MFEEIMVEMSQICENINLYRCSTNFKGDKFKEIYNDFGFSSSCREFKSHYTILITNKKLNELKNRLFLDL